MRNIDSNINDIGKADIYFIVLSAFLFLAD